MASKLKVAFVGQPEYNAVFYETDLNEIYSVKSFPIIFDIGRNMECSLKSMDDLVQFAPDITVIFRAEFVGNDVLDKIRGIKIGISTEPFPKYIEGIFHFTSDSIARFRHFTTISQRGLDYILHYDETSLSFMERMGVCVSAPMVLPIATRVWSPRDPAIIDWDVVFFGRSTSHREPHFGALKRDCRFLHVAHGMEGKHTIPFYQSARIGLNIHAEPELSWEPRVQQMMACGLLVVSEPISSNAFVKPGVHFLESSSPSETYRICREAIANPTRFESIRRGGYENVAANLAARDIWPRLFERCLANGLPAPRFDLARLRLEPFEICAQYNGFEHLLDQLKDDHA